MRSNPQTPSSECRSSFSIIISFFIFISGALRVSDSSGNRLKENDVVIPWICSVSISLSVSVKTYQTKHGFFSMTVFDLPTKAFHLGNKKVDTIYAFCCVGTFAVVRGWCIKI